MFYGEFRLKCDRNPDYLNLDYTSLSDPGRMMNVSGVLGAKDYMTFGENIYSPYTGVVINLNENSIEIEDWIIMGWKK